MSQSRVPKWFKEEAYKRHEREIDPYLDRGEGWKMPRFLSQINSWHEETAKQEEKKARALFLFMFWTTLGGPDGEIISQRTAMSRLGKIGLPTGHIMREKSKGWQSRKHKV